MNRSSFLGTLFVLVFHPSLQTHTEPTRRPWLQLSGTWHSNNVYEAWGYFLPALCALKRSIDSQEKEILQLYCLDKKKLIRKYASSPILRFNVQDQWWALSESKIDEKKVFLFYSFNSRAQIKLIQTTCVSLTGFISLTSSKVYFIFASLLFSMLSWICFCCSLVSSAVIKLLQSL